MKNINKAIIKTEARLAEFTGTPKYNSTTGDFQWKDIK